MNIEKKTISELIDSLITTSNKCFAQQEIVMNAKDKNIIADAAVLTQKLNKRRCDLMRAIDERFNESENSVTEKTYK
jgi:hypothetical protein